ncbi:MAG TPA: helix-turn-helix domain-containing protein [Polyangiaceae bacterium]|nr:helix-turn-helix domain-containing protein [Polyangiaceae bacterium]
MNAYDRPFVDMFPEPAPSAPRARTAAGDAARPVEDGWDAIIALLTRVAAPFGRTPEAVLGQSRGHSVAAARRACYRELRAMHWSYPEIGRLFRRDQSSIRSALESHPEEAA